MIKEKESYIYKLEGELKVREQEYQSLNEKFSKTNSELLLIEK
jgi:hypothetical protein